MSNLTDLNKRVYNCYLKNYRQGEPYRPRKDFSNINPNIATSIIKISNFLTKFPHIKCEQILYYFYSTQDNVTEKLVRTQEAVLRLMDRGDETAEEINDWCKNRQVTLEGELVDNMFYFHNFKVYQLEETRDIIDFGTARTYGGNKFIIDYDYHQMGSRKRVGYDENMKPIYEYRDGLTSDTWKPEFRPEGSTKDPI
jgi:hypothetical protein